MSLMTPSGMGMGAHLSPGRLRRRSRSSRAGSHFGRSLSGTHLVLISGGPFQGHTSFSFRAVPFRDTPRSHFGRSLSGTHLVLISGGPFQGHTSFSFRAVPFRDTPSALTGTSSRARPHRISSRCNTI